MSAIMTTTSARGIHQTLIPKRFLFAVERDFRVRISRPSTMGCLRKYENFHVGDAPARENIRFSRAVGLCRLHAQKKMQKNKIKNLTLAAAHLMVTAVIVVVCRCLPPLLAPSPPPTAGSMRERAAASRLCRAGEGHLHRVVRMNPLPAAAPGRRRPS